MAAPGDCMRAPAEVALPGKRPARAPQLGFRQGRPRPREGKHRIAQARSSEIMSAEQSLSDALEGRVGCDRAPDV